MSSSLHAAEADGAQNSNGTSVLRLGAARGLAGQVPETRPGKG